MTASHEHAYLYAVNIEGTMPPLSDLDRLGLVLGLAMGELLFLIDLDWGM